MSDNFIFGFMDTLVTAARIYLVYVWYLLKFKNIVKSGVLLPSQKQVNVKCKDIEGYKKAAKDAEKEYFSRQTQGAEISKLCTQLTHFVETNNH